MGLRHPPVRLSGISAKIQKLFRSLLHSCLVAGKNKCPFTIPGAAPWEFG
jgi:hypothetical protein